MLPSKASIAPRILLLLRISVLRAFPNYSATSLLNNAVKTVDKSIKLKEEFPHITENGKWVTTLDGYWTGGFWVGLLWHSYKIYSDEKYKNLAYNWLKK
jgi:unsaturated chondroitin disaccharide hydrolase